MATVAREAPLEIVCTRLALPAVVAAGRVDVAVVQHQPFALPVVPAANGSALSAARRNLPSCRQLRGLSAVEHERAAAFDHMRVRSGVDAAFVELRKGVIAARAAVRCGEHGRADGQ